MTLEQPLAVLGQERAEMLRILPEIRNWLGGRDSNPDNVVQSHVSYRWTTSQCQLTRSESARTIDYSQSKTGRASASPAPEHRAIRERARRKTCTTARGIDLDPLTATNRSIRAPARSAHSRPSTRFPNPAACGDGSPSRPFGRLRALPHWSTRAPSPSDARPSHPCWRCRVACFCPSTQNHDLLLPHDPPTQAGYERCPGSHLLVADWLPLNTRAATDVPRPPVTLSNKGTWEKVFHSDLLRSATNGSGLSS